MVGGREAPMNVEQQEEAERSIVGEFSGVKHTRGVLSMGRWGPGYLLPVTCYPHW